MAKGNVSEFLRLMNAANDAIAAREREAANNEQVGVDSIRLAREAERRERWGTLRAREHAGNRQRKMRPVFGYVKL